MKASKNRVISTLAAITLASVIGLAYAETGYNTKSGTSAQGTTGTSNVNATGTTVQGASGTTNLNANDSASQGNSGTMNQNAATSTSQ